MLVYNENRVWIRITNYCNSKCKFCLESPQIRTLPKIEDVDIKLKIKKWYKEWYKNKLILSGGEASVDSRLVDFIKYGREIWYTKIQTVTNWLRWWNFEFCQKAIEAGLAEVTFSIHWHNSELHDDLTWVPWSFKNIVKAIYNLRKLKPDIIINADLVINPQNILDAYKIVQVLKKLDVWEFDILQVIPFWFAWDIHKDEMLFENVYDYKNEFELIWKESLDPRVHMWANRVFPELLEWYEHMIQSPEKIEDEVANEWKDHREDSFNKREKFSCSDELRCKNCYVRFFCEEKYHFYDLEKNNYGYKPELAQSYKLFTHKDIFKLNDVYPENADEFVCKVNSAVVNSQSVVNLPYCIVNKNNYFTNFLDSWLDKTFDNYISWFEDEWFRLKSSRCNECKLNKLCKWLHINLIKKYWFKILNPILDN